MKKLPLFFYILSAAGLLKYEIALASGYFIVVTQSPTIPSTMEAGGEYGPYSYTIQNNYSRALPISITNIDGSIVSPTTAPTNPCGSTIAPGSSCNLAINIHPSAQGTIQQSPHISYDSRLYTPLPSLNINVASSGASYVLVSDDTANTVYAFAPHSSGQVSSLFTLGGGTTLDAPNGLWVDAAKNLWVASSGNNSVQEYAYPWSGTGDSPELNINVGGQTDIVATAIAKDGTLYVSGANRPGVTVYATPPTETGLNDSSNGALWAPSNGSDMSYYVANPNDSTITEFTAQAVGSPTPSRTITSSSMTSPVSIWVDNGGHIWSTDSGTPSSIIEFAANASGISTPICSIGSTSIHTPLAIAVDSVGYVYELDSSDDINVFGPGNCGSNITPAYSYTLTGGFTSAVNMTIYDPNLYSSNDKSSISRTSLPA